MNYLFLFFLCYIYNIMDSLNVQSGGRRKRRQTKGGRKQKRKRNKGGSFLGDVSVPAGLLLLNQFIFFYAILIF